MAEAQPARKRGGHAFGRQQRQSRMLSNTAEEGELCLYTGHAIRRFSSHSMRYDSHQACVRCIAAAREGRLSFDIDRLLKKNRERALKFWSFVDIAGPDECWNWQGTINPRTKQPQFSWRRPSISKSTQHHPQRVAMWFSWGDLGFTGVKTTCGNKYCCNPFHLIPQNVGVFVDHGSHLESFELACQIHTLKQQVAEYVMEQAIKEAAKQDKSELIDQRAAMMVDKGTDFEERFSAVMVDLLAGIHQTQIDPSSEGLYRDPVDNDKDDKPTEQT